MSGALEVQCTTTCEWCTRSAVHYWCLPYSASENEWSGRPLEKLSAKNLKQLQKRWGGGGGGGEKEQEAKRQGSTKLLSLLSEIIETPKSGRNFFLETTRKKF